MILLESYTLLSCKAPVFLIFAIYKHLEQGSKLQTALRRHIFFHICSYLQFPVANPCFLSSLSQF